eukprot:gene9124-18900_t
MHFNFIVFLSIIVSITSWHAYNIGYNGSSHNSKECKPEYKGSNRRLFNYFKRGNVFNLWSVGVSQMSSMQNGEHLYGFLEAMRIIWRNQNPSNCSAAKYLISPGLFSGAGFGAELHVDGAILALAIQLGRVLIDSPYSIKRNVDIKENNSFCKRQGKRNKECFYEPWSKCSLDDAIGGRRRGEEGRSINTLLEVFHGRNTNTNTDTHAVLSGGGGGDISSSIQLVNFTDDRIRTIMRDPTAAMIRDWDRIRTIVLDIPLRQNHGFRKVIPSSMSDILRCSPMKPEHWTYWWRAMSTAYLLRPNVATRTWLHQQRQGHDKLPHQHPHQSSPMSMSMSSSSLSQLHSQSSLTLTLSKGNNDSCISVYVRRGDKFKEMSLGDKGTMFFNSEDPDVLSEAQVWAHQTGWSLQYTTVIDRNQSRARLPRPHHALLEEEYLAMILNLEYALQCDAWVCTLASNYCRVIDELRATVSGKAHLPYADLSRETCVRPPCIGSRDISTFLW